MSADIEKLAVFDSRIIQSRAKYSVSKGALSLTNAPFNAIAATSSQHTYNIYVPSENVFVDRAVEWSSTCYMRYNVGVSGPTVGGDAVVVQGRDWSLCAFPLNSLCSTMTATINDTTSVINSQDVLTTVLRLTDYKKNRLQRTCPTMLDKYASYDDANGAINNPLSGYENSTDYAEVPNGAFYNVVYTDPSGQPLGTSVARTPAFAGAPYSAVNGVPIFFDDWSSSVTYLAGQVVQSGGFFWTAVTPVVGTPPASPAWTQGALVAGTAYPIYIQWTSTEKLVLSPFVFSDVHEWDTGLFGINNIQLIMNLQAPSRLVRNSKTAAGRVIDGASIAYNSGYPSGPFSRSVVNVQFLTPSLDVPLPPKSIVPYMEFPRYITQYQNPAIQPGQTGQLVSQTITLPQIPDMFIIYAKPQTYTTPGGVIDPSQGDWYFPVASRADSVANPLSINFDNFSGLLSSVTTEQLYAMSVKNGLDMDYNTWVGAAHSEKGGRPATTVTNSLGAGRVPLVGSVLVLRPSQDITLQTGQAPSLVGNFTFQFQLTVKNTSASPLQPQLYVIAANSGFFESIRGSSRIIKGVLSEQDIISAPLAPVSTHTALQRLVGGKGIGPSLSTAMSKAKDLYHATKPAVSALVGMLPDTGKEGKFKAAARSVGYGTGGGTGGMERRCM